MEDYESKYLTFVVDDGTVNFSRENNGSYEYKYSSDDGSTWATIGNTPFSVTAGNKIILKGNGGDCMVNNIKSSGNGHWHIEGNAMSLLFGDNFASKTSMEEKQFSATFRNCTNLTSAENMVLPATTLSNSCYASMFYGCTNLTKAPKLSASTLVTNCYRNMFKGCRSLNAITCLAEDITAKLCTGNWVKGVSSNGTFTVKEGKEEMWREHRGVNGAPNNWTVSGDAPAPPIPTDAKFTASYSDGTEYSIDCNDSSTLTEAELNGGGDRAKIVSVSIGECVTTIGESAFKSCSSLTNIQIPSSVKTIGNTAFSSCSSLTSIKIPSSVTSIGAFIFSNCSNLGSIIVDNNNTVYDSRNNCNAIIKKSNNQLIYGCKGTVIPNTVTSIGNEAFNGISGSFKSIVIPDSVTSIGEFSFQECVALEDVKMSANIKTIGRDCFSRCYSLKEITIGSKITSIGDMAFEECDDLESIKIMATTPPTLGVSAFYNTNDCPIYVPQNSVDSYKNADMWKLYKDRIVGFEPPVGVKFTATDANGNVYSASCNESSALTVDEVNAVCDKLAIVSVEIGDCVGYIKNDTFSGCTNLTNIIISDSVTKIGSNSFYKCTALTTLEIPSNVSEIYSSAFNGCSSLEYIKVYRETPPSLSSYVFNNTNNCPIYVPSGSVNTYVNASGWSNYKSRIDGFTPIIPTGNKFSATYTDGTNYSIACDGYITLTPNEVVREGYEKSSMKTVEIGSCVTNIGEKAFQGYNGLTTVAIDNGVSTIKNGAFSNCTSLTNINMPNSITHIGYGTFSGCSSLETVSLPNSIISLAKDCFTECTNLNKLIVPNSVTTIENTVFRKCNGITSVGIIGSGASIEIPNSVTKISSSCFSICSNLKNVELPDSITTLEDYMFYGCYGLEKLKLPKNLKNIAGALCAYDSKLSAVTLGDSVEYIGTSSFLQCSSLTNITIPETIKTIDASAFKYCHITELTLGANIGIINYEAFASSSLKKITIKAITPPTLGYNVFTNTPEDLKIYVPSGSVTAYKTATNWTEWADKIQPIQT